MTRLAQREPSQRERIASVVDSDPERLLELALTVAVETGEPMTEVLVEVLSDAELSDALLARVSKDLDKRPGLDEVTIVACRRLLPRVRDDAPLHGVALLLRIAESTARLGRYEESLAAVADADALADLVTADDRPPARMETDLRRARLLGSTSAWEGSLEHYSRAPETARRYLATENDPRIARLVGERSEAMQRLGRFAEAAHGWLESAQMWHQLADRGDLDMELAWNRAATEPGEGLGMHVTVGTWRSDSWGGPDLGYRVNTSISDHYGLVRNVPADEPKFMLAHCLAFHGVCCLIAGEADAAASSLNAARQAAFELPADSEWAAHLRLVTRVYYAAAAQTREERSEALEQLSEALRFATAGEVTDAALAVVNERTLRSTFSRQVLGYLGALLTAARDCPVEDGLLPALVRGGWSLAVQLRMADHSEASAQLLTQLAGETAGHPDPDVAELRVPVLVALANAHLRRDRPERALASAEEARQVVEAMPHKGATTAVVNHAGVQQTLARSLAALDRREEALVAVAQALSLVDEHGFDDAQGARVAVGCVDLYAFLVAPSGRHVGAAAGGPGHGATPTGAGRGTRPVIWSTNSRSSASTP